jgi:hypothetical protein
MLAISEQTMQTLEASARPLFARRVQAALADKYPHFLPRFPDTVQATIVGNMLGRASRWSIHGQQALLAFSELMIAVAGNFDEQAEIHAVLEATKGARDRTVIELPGLVRDEVWAKASSNAATLPFYIRPALTGKAAAEQVAAALPVVLHDRPEAADAAAAVQGAQPVAGRLGLADDADSLLVIAACRSFYGEDFDERRLAWAPDLFGAGLTPRAVVNALRLRLALDFARFV